MNVLVPQDEGWAAEPFALFPRVILMPVDLNEAVQEHQRGNLARAARIYEAALAEDQDRVDALYLLGVLATQKSDPRRAVALIGRAAALRPADAVIHANLAEAYRTLGDYDRTIDCCRTALRLDPNHPDVHSNLALALLSKGDLEGAIGHYRAAIRLRPGFTAAHHGLGKVLQTLGRLDEAKICFLEALRLEPRHAMCHVSLAHVYEQLGELDQAMEAFRGALNCDPRHPGALARLAQRLRGGLPHADQAAIESLLAEPALPLEPAVQLRFGLAQTLDARGEFDRAANLTIEANALQLTDFRKRGVLYDPVGHRLFTDKLIAAFTPSFFERVRGFGIDTERPVFVVGLPRSGTTLTEQVLASHPRVHGAGELTLTRRIFESLPGAILYGGMPFDFLPYLDRETTQRVAHRYAKALAAVDATADRVVDKMPDNTVYLGLIATVFPHAKIIHCRRDLRDVALSCWMTDFLEVRWACDPDLIARRIELHQQLMEHWRQVLPTPMLEVDYEELVTDLEQGARALIAWCGLEWDPACLEFHKTRRVVRTSSVTQVRQPVHTGSIGRWRNYETALAPLFAKLNRPAGDRA
jgi:tetratricopeptide (TPR) repeat protein